MRKLTIVLFSLIFFSNVFAQSAVSGGGGQAGNGNAGDPWVILLNPKEPLSEDQRCLDYLRYRYDEFNRDVEEETLDDCYRIIQKKIRD